MAVNELMKGYDVLAILPKGLNKSLIYVNFSLTEQELVKNQVDKQCSIIVISPLKSIISDQIEEIESLNCSPIELQQDTINEIMK